MKTGFYAPTRAEEPKCPGMECLGAEGIEDVTDKVNAPLSPACRARTPAKAQRRDGTLEKQCSRRDIRCDVVTLYSGAMYNLYSYKKYGHAAGLAPSSTSPSSAAIPTISSIPATTSISRFFRAYENGQPAQTANYLKWSSTA